MTPINLKFRRVFTHKTEVPPSWHQMMADLASPEWNLKFEHDQRFLREVIYAGLQDLNTGFDSERIVWFSPADFLIVIDRCESRHVRVIGIEVATTDVNPLRKQCLWKSRSLRKKDMTGLDAWS